MNKIQDDKLLYTETCNNCGFDVLFCPAYDDIDKIFKHVMGDNTPIGISVGTITKMCTKCGHTITIAIVCPTIPPEK